MLKVLSRSVRWLVLLGLAYVGILWVQPEPPFRDFKARADIEYGGRTIEGPLRCTRSLPWVPFGLVAPPPHGGNSYDWSDVGIGQRLADGSAVVVALGSRGQRVSTLLATRNWLSAFRARRSSIRSGARSFP